MKIHLIESDHDKSLFITYCGLIRHVEGWIVQFGRAIPKNVRAIEKTTCKSCIKVYRKRNEQKRKEQK